MMRRVCAVGCPTTLMNRGGGQRVVAAGVMSWNATSLPSHTTSTLPLSHSPKLSTPSSIARPPLRPSMDIAGSRRFSSTSSSDTGVVDPALPRRSVRNMLAWGVAGIAGFMFTLWVVPRDMLVGPLFTLRVLEEGMCRILRCVRVGLDILVDYKFNLTDTSTQAEWDEVHLRSSNKLVVLAERNGGLYIKAGQVFCSMNLLLPAPYWRTLSKLQNAVTARPFSEIRTVLEWEYGRPLESIYAEFSEEPIAAASMAQVHTATVREDLADDPAFRGVAGRHVAVKVQYIDIATRFTSDIITINTMLRGAGIAFPGYDFSQIVTGATQSLIAELDFENEARNSERCAREIASQFGDIVVTPTVHWPLTRRRVLTTEFIKDAVKVTDLAGLKKLGIAPKWVMEYYLGVCAYQIFCTGFVHADPHPGNVLCHRHPVTGQPQLVMLDHGLYTELSRSQRSTLTRLWTAIIESDEETGTRISTDELGVPNFELLASMLLQFPYRSFSPFKGAATIKDHALMQEMARERMHEVTETLEKLPIEYSLVLRNMAACRAANKEVGNPQVRTVLMYRYSVRASAELRAAGEFGMADVAPTLSDTPSLTSFLVAVIAYQLACLRSWIAVQYIVLMLRVREQYNDVQMALLKALYPDVYAVVDDMLSLG